MDMDVDTSYTKENCLTERTRVCKGLVTVVRGYFLLFSYIFVQKLFEKGDIGVY